MSRRIQIISLWNPWALFVILGLKRFETRSWGGAKTMTSLMRSREVKYRGTLGIHAAKRWTDQERWTLRQLALDFNLSVDKDSPWGRLWHHDPTLFGVLLGTVNLVDIHPTETMIHMTRMERALGNYEYNRFAWELRDPVVFQNPIPMIGHQGMWTWDMPASIPVEA